ncbi:hypothetical protein LX87_01327 [Larkinella arboricola]|uniref:Uncharacterized protein n=1 Tax=Larkinella arboricola TaxID=643671 RepID=A0A327X8F7_LARAB|nr:hypothetical protein LX87_01327 [Larkinella arboricola]
MARFLISHNLGDDFQTVILHLSYKRNVVGGDADYSDKNQNIFYLTVIFSRHTSAVLHFVYF